MIRRFGSYIAKRELGKSWVDGYIKETRSISSHDGRQESIACAIGLTLSQGITSTLSSYAVKLWQSQTPSNTLELGSQTTLVKQRIQRHVDSAPTPMVEAFEKVPKGPAIIAHMLVLAQKDIAELRAAHEAAT
jgi:hypothetical protein